jgi:hypothetical protein
MPQNPTPQPQSRQFTRNPFGKDPSDPYYVSRLGTDELAALISGKIAAIDARMTPEYFFITGESIVAPATQKNFNFPQTTDPAKCLWQLVQARFLLNNSGDGANAVALTLHCANTTWQYWVSYITPAATDIFHNYLENGVEMTGTTPPSPVQVVAAANYYLGNAAGLFKGNEPLGVNILGGAGSTNVLYLFLTFRKLIIA